MTSTVAIYFNYRDTVSALGGKAAKDAMTQHINYVFESMELMSTVPQVSTLLQADGITETDDSDYGAIVVLEYAEDVSLGVAMECSNWLSSETKKGNRVPVIGIVHSSGGLILTSTCAMQLFSVTLSYRPTLYCMEKSALNGYTTLARTVLDNKLYIDGCILCTKPTCYVICTVSGVSIISKEEAVKLVTKCSEGSPCDSMVVYSYDGGNLSQDCQFISYIQSLYAVSYAGKKRIIISGDLCEMSKVAKSKFTRKVVLCGIVSYTIDSKVSFVETTKPVYVPFAANDKLFS